MTLSMKEKKILYAFACPSHHNTVTRLKWLTALTVDPEDKEHLILDPETAPVIRKIYDLALDGWGCMRIAKQLMDDKIPITRVKSNTECDVNYYS